MLIPRACVAYPGPPHSEIPLGAQPGGVSGCAAHTQTCSLVMLRRKSASLIGAAPALVYCDLALEGPSVSPGVLSSVSLQFPSSEWERVSGERVSVACRI